MKLIPLFHLLVLTQVLSAQTFQESVQIPPFTNLKFSAIAFADVDGDLDDDVLITGRTSPPISHITKLYINDGLGNYTEMPNNSFVGVSGSSVAFADVDGDTDQDVLITGSGSSGKISKLYMNDGTGNYAEMSGTLFEGVAHGSIAFADVDGDTDLDVLITGSGSSGKISKLYTNDGLGNFTEMPNTTFVGVFRSSIAFADVDGDTDLDVLITGEIGIDSAGHSIGISKLYANDGQGNYTGMINTTFSGISDGSVAFADVDSDLDLDVLITGRVNPFTPISKLYTNDGGGNFTEMIGTPFEGVGESAITFADVDGDFDKDVLITGNGSQLTPTSKLYNNDGTGNYTEMTGTPFVEVAFGSIAFTDVDGDSDQDVFITGEMRDSFSFPAISKLYINHEEVSLIDDFNKTFTLEFTSYPNPALSNSIHIIYDLVDNGCVNLNIYDLNGHILIRHKELVATGQQTIAVDISSLSRGSYVIELGDGKRKGFARFMVQ